MSKKLFCLASFVLVLGMVLTNVAGANDPNLVAWWMFSEGAGDIAHDSSGNGHDGTLVGTPKWIDGPEGFGSALEFNPDGLQRVECGTFDPTNGTGLFTVAFWGYWDGTEAHQHFFSKADAWSVDTMMFQIELRGHNDGEVTAAFEGTDQISFFSMPPYEWVHIALTFDGTNIRCYFNGVENVLGPQPFSLGTGVNVGLYLGSAEPWRGRILRGAMDDVRVYDYPMTRDKIRILMVSGEDMDLNPALLPEPADGTIEVPREVTLNWMAGQYASTHDVYLGRVFDDVNEAGRDNPLGVLVSQGQSETTYDPPGLLEYGQRYYWRVDEVNDLNPNSPWKGNVWSFTVIDYFIVVDDFESYNDLNPGEPNSNRIFNTWIDGYQVPANGAIVGYADPPFAEQTIVRSGEQSMPYYYDNTAAATSEAVRTFSSAQYWSGDGVGALSLWFRGNLPYFGNFAETAPGAYTMTGSGADVWARADEFHFAYKELSGAVSIIARVDSLDNTDPFAKAGVMIRDTLDADSANAYLFVTPENGVRFQRRTNAGGNTGRDFVEGITAPQWVRLERTAGGLVRAYYSADGTTWTRLGIVIVSMDMPVYVGLAVTSHNVKKACEAKFSEVSFPDTTVDPQWTNQDIGILSNGAETMYVTVTDGSGKAATVPHDDPNAVNIFDAWTQWNVDLKGFTDGGVDLTDVSKLTIGFGGADNPQLGGSGLMYFDDIRLYLPAP